ncbi:MAG: D-glycerate dehydrogenase [Gammaproteobacteria bacterium]
MPKVLITRRWPSAVEAELQRRYELTVRDSSLSAAEWHSALNEYDAICPCVIDKITADMLTVLNPRTKIIANFGVGYNHIDLVAAAARGISVTNTPDVLTHATADLAMTLMFMLARRAGEGERQLRSHQWHGWYPTHLMGTQVTGATLGIIGMGRIGMAMAQKAHDGFGMKILYHNRKPVNESMVYAMKAEYCSDMNNLLQRSDFVAVHCPGGKNNRHMINAAALAQMQPHAFLINTARGDVVDESALVIALQQGQIAGAGLDVYESEPEVSQALLTMENVVLLPHLGSATTATREAMGMRVLSNLDAFFSGQQLPDRVV